MTILVRAGRASIFSSPSLCRASCEGYLPWKSLLYTFLYIFIFWPLCAFHIYFHFALVSVQVLQFVYLSRRPSNKKLWEVMELRFLFFTQKMYIEGKVMATFCSFLISRVWFSTISEQIHNNEREKAVTMLAFPFFSSFGHHPSLYSGSSASHPPLFFPKTKEGGKESRRKVVVNFCSILSSAALRAKWHSGNNTKKQTTQTHTYTRILIHWEKWGTKLSAFFFYFIRSQ